MSKLLGGADLDVESDSCKGLVVLRDHIEDLASSITDPQSLEALETMAELLEDVQETASLEDEDGNDEKTESEAEDGGHESLCEGIDSIQVRDKLDDDEY